MRAFSFWTERPPGIDSYTELLIQKAIVTLLTGALDLVIAHASATIR